MPKCWAECLGDCSDKQSGEENLGAAVVELSPNDVRDLEDASSKIKLEGARYPAFHAKLVGR